MTFHQVNNNFAHFQPPQPVSSPSSDEDWEFPPYDEEWSLDFPPSPTYELQNNNEDSGPSYSTPLEAQHYYNYAPNFTNIGPRDRIPSAIPSRRSDNRSPAIQQDQIINNQTYNEWMAWNNHINVLESNEYFMDYESDWIELLERENPMTHRNAGGLSEEVIFMFLKTRNCNKDDSFEICVVCQDDLCQENQMIGMLRCSHNYHAMCIKQWLQEKNICPLCKTTALSVDDEHEP
ncbi:hypothetical protein BUALT_Bualt02G0200300 [Buddleja alternifolia]|uniref:RING-type E3 ubiquitin transferase n=1 Tax=Buddleja alternifolia TaxID=168488 RepID=A0AAV6Y8H7_9LAMI|nr:hypothetical protein BUALT_Bualt02G0200300 [Buddleja alternifolia]